MKKLGNKEPTKIYQDKFGDEGNCMSACLAMMLDIPLSSVPNFFDMGDTERQWWNALREWLAEYNVGIVTTDLKGALLHATKGYLIVGGSTERGLEHAVIYKDGELWHDPHPKGSGLKEVSGVDFLYPLNPLIPFGIRIQT